MVACLQWGRAPDAPTCGGSICVEGERSASEARRRFARWGTRPGRHAAGIYRNVCDASSVNAGRFHAVDFVTDVSRACYGRSPISFPAGDGRASLSGNAFSSTTLRVILLVQNALRVKAMPRTFRQCGQKQILCLSTGDPCLAFTWISLSSFSQYGHTGTSSVSMTLIFAILTMISYSEDPARSRATLIGNAKFRLRISGYAPVPG